MNNQIQENLDWGVSEIKVMLKCGIEPEDALGLLLDDWRDWSLFLEYLQDIGEKDLFKKLTKNAKLPKTK